MKKLILISMIAFLSQTMIIQGQCTADAGPDVVVCCDWNGLDITQLGGDPTASGGTPPYTYIWETSWIVGPLTFTASDFLDDTSLANPSVMYSGEDLTFSLTVIDSELNQCTDTVHVDFTNYGTHLGYVNYSIQQGDSIYLSGWQNIFGGFPPFEYLWRPNHGLTDSTSLSFWAKPDSSVAYYLTVTDSSGCTVVGAPVYYVTVIPVSTDLEELNEIEISVYPNPSNEQVTISVRGSRDSVKTIDVFDIHGRLILSVETRDEAIKLNARSLTPGVNFYSLTMLGKIIGRGKIIVE